MKTDVAVIGGGAIGLCTAYYLWKKGAQVVLVEKGGIGSGCSLHNAGYVCPSHFIPLASPGIISRGLRWMLNPSSPFYIKPRLNRQFLSWAWKFRQSCNEENVRRAVPLLRDLGVESYNLYAELARIDGMDFGWTRKGLFIFFRTERGRHAMVEEEKLAKEIGIEAQLHDRQGIQKLEPNVEIRADGGLYFPGDAHVTPARFVQNLEAFLEKQTQVRIFRNTSVLGFERSGDRVVSLKTTNGEFPAAEFVLCGGAWSPGILRSLGIRLLVEAGKGYSITIPRKDRKPAIPFVLTEARVAVTPMGDTLRFAGTMELAGLDLSITQRRVNAIQKAIDLYIGGFSDADFQNKEVWSGLRPVSPDGVPFIGRFKDYPNLIAATGHAMIGMSLAPVTGKIVSQLVEGEQPGFDMRLLNPDRFRGQWK